MLFMMTLNCLFINDENDKLFSIDITAAGKNKYLVRN